MIGIIDYGMGNLGSVSNACRFLKLPAKIVEEPAQLKNCDALILPGVGAFGDCMKHLRDRGFVDVLDKWISNGRPFLGICLGLQVLFADSEESPGVPGLGVLPGRVRKFPPAPGLKIPQIGWNRIQIRTPSCPLFQGIAEGSHVYFVHSYYPECENSAVVACETEYGVIYTSAVWRDNVMAVQFHPEKSQKTGLKMLANFAEAAGVTA